MNNIKEAFERFTKSYVYFFLMAFLTLTCWYFDMPVYGMLLASIFLFIASVFSDNLIQIPAVLSMFYMSGRCYEEAKLSLWLVIPLVFIAVLSLIIIVFRFKDRFSIKKIIKNKLIYGYLIMFAVMMISVINSEYKTDTLGNSLHYFSSIIVFVFAVSFIDLGKEEDRNRMLHSFIIICVMIFFQYVIFFFENYDGSNFIEYIRSKNNLLIGWSHPNHCLVLFNMTVAISLYLFINNKKIFNRIIYVAFMLLTIGSALLINSRGGQIGFGVILLSYIVYYCIRSEKTRKPFIIISISLVVLIAAGIIVGTQIPFIKEKLKAFDIESFTSDRYSLWQLGMDKFKENLPIGYGVGTSQHYIFDVLGRTEANYHSYVVQITQAGILGICAFVILILLLVYNLKELDDFNIMLSSMIIMFIIWGLIDTLFFNMRIEPFFVFLMAFKKQKIEELELVSA